MFDISFTELMVIGVVALVVIGPERLPGVARTAGALLGRLQRYVSDVKADVQREMRLEEMKKLQSEIESQARGIESQVRTEMQAVETSVEGVTASVDLPPSAPSLSELVDASARPAPAPTATPPAVPTGSQAPSSAPSAALPASSDKA